MRQIQLERWCEMEIGLYYSTALVTYKREIQKLSQMGSGSYNNEAHLPISLILSYILKKTQSKITLCRERDTCLNRN